MRTHICEGVQLLVAELGRSTDKGMTFNFPVWSDLFFVTARVAKRAKVTCPHAYVCSTLEGGQWPVLGGGDPLLGEVILSWGGWTSSSPPPPPRWDRSLTPPPPRWDRSLTSPRWDRSLTPPPSVRILLECILVSKCRRERPRWPSVWTEV